LRDKTIEQPGDFVLPRHRARDCIAIVLAVGFCAVFGGCQNVAGVLEDKNEGGFFSKPMDVFAKPDWARPVAAEKAGRDLDAGGPAGPDDLVGADGTCSAAAAQAQAQPVAAVPQPVVSAPPAASASVAPPPDRLVPAEAAPAPVMGGIALGMTECQAVQRAGMPGNVAIGAGNRGERQVVLTYLSGPWPGIYHFNEGRLKEIDRAPTPPEPPKAPSKKKKPTTKKTGTAKTSQRGTEVVQ
jgi:hypothetical protein